MNTSISWKEIKYNEAYEQELRALKRRRESDPGCTTKDIEGVLQNLYIMEGAGDLGEVAIINMAAIIAAHEYFITQWKLEKDQ